MSNTRGGLTETWAMVWTKRAHTVETLKQPSPDLRLRASYFYPDPASGFALPWQAANVLI